MANYSERLKDITILQLDTEGFEKLTQRQKKLTYFLAKAGLWGRFISMDQGSKHNSEFLGSLIELYEKVEPTAALSKNLQETLFTIFAHNGVYHSTSGEKLVLPLDLVKLLSYKDVEPKLVQEIISIWFSDKIAKFRTVQTDGVDVIAQSGGNFYSGLTTSEVQDFRKESYPATNGDEVPPWGFNERLVKNSDGTIERQIISETGLYGQYVSEIIDNLVKALEFSENEAQHKSISTLIDFYKTGSAKDFDTHCVAWTQDRDSSIYFINGLIESYEDPLGIGCTFESVVAFKNPVQTAKVNKIIENIQWFEDNLPFDKKFKKDKAQGLSASSINVISMAGETSPSLPLGVNLPNSDWIRKKHGSKSVNLANVAAARSSSEKELRNALYLDKYHGELEAYANLTNSLHTDLHEIAGHGSGKTLEGVNTDVLGVYYSTIEEARADLVALYFMIDPKLKEFGVYDSDIDVDKAGLAQYVSYLTNGAISQLRRVDLGNDLTQAHFRNRQLISNWILEHGDKSKVRMVEKEGSYFIEIDDAMYVRQKLGELLSIVQEIKSTGDYDGAKNLVMTYGTKVNQGVHKELLARIEKLDLPKVVGFITPELIDNGREVVLEQPTNFFEQQMRLHKDYFTSLLEKKKKLVM